MTPRQTRSMTQAINKLTLLQGIGTRQPNLPKKFAETYAQYPSGPKHIPLAVPPSNDEVYAQECYGLLLCEMARLLEKADGAEKKIAVVVSGTKHIGKSSFYGWVLHNLHTIV